MGIPGFGRIVAAVAAVTLVGACSSGGSRGASAPATPSSAVAAPPSSPGTGDPLPTPGHVVVVVFENKDAQRVEGGQAPYLRSLVARGAAFTDAHGETHPSQPNYL